jgi:cell division septation protein DedD
MNTSIERTLRKLAKASAFLGSAFVLVGLFLSVVHLPAEAAGASREEDARDTASSLPACTPPGNWNETVRLSPPKSTSKQWSFDVAEAEMDVELKFIYYQDYDKRGCPFDCEAGECQLAETGHAESPLGSFDISDGQLGATGGSEKLSGQLTQGSYQVVFNTTGTGSINIGLRITTSSLPTDVPPEPTDTPQPTPTPTLTTTATATPPVDEPPTATPTDVITPAPPGPTATPTATGTTATVLPPVPTETPGEDLTDTPVPTLAPPSPPANTTPSPVLIPITGADLSAGAAKASHMDFLTRLLLRSGMGLLGLGLVAYGLTARYRRSPQ